jgi:hypothetical protein
MHTELCGWQERYIDILGAAFPTGDYVNWTKCQALFPHVEAMERYRVTDTGHLQVWAKTLYRIHLGVRRMLFNNLNFRPPTRAGCEVR